MNGIPTYIQTNLNELTQRQLALWAQETQLSPEEVFKELHAGFRYRSLDWSGTLIENGGFSKINWDMERLPIRNLRWIPGQEITHLSFTLPETKPVPEDFLYCVPLPKLTHLCCSLMHLKRIDLYDKSRLEVLDLGYNQLEELPPCPIHSLRELNVSSNRFRKLDLRLYPNLCRLNCEDNGLEELNIPMLLLLRVLCCGDNKLRQIDVASSPVLLSLHCPENQLTEIDLRSAFRLVEVDVSRNNISELTLPSKGDLEWLCCDENPIWQLELDHLTKLSEAFVSLQTRVSCRSDQTIKRY